MPERIKERAKTSFWDKILKGDIKKQANVVEFMGIVGLILFVVLMGVLWTVKIDITVPTQEARVIDDASRGILIKAEVPDPYASSINKEQEAKIVLIFDDKTKVNTTGTIIEVRESSADIPLIIIVKPNPGIEFHGILKRTPKDIRMRITIEKKRFFSIFIQKKHKDK